MEVGEKTKSYPPASGRIGTRTGETKVDLAKVDLTKVDLPAAALAHALALTLPPPMVQGRQNRLEPNPPASHGYPPYFRPQKFPSPLPYMCGTKGVIGLHF